MGWLSPPDRREITLLFFCVAVYVLAYNLETSLQLLGVDSVATSGALFSRIGLGKTRAIDHDGRKPNGWRDKLELEIFGDWKWEEGHVAGDSDEHTQRIGTGQHGAAWASKAEVRQVAGNVFSDVSVTEALQWWGDTFPQTRVLKHAPGYTVLDNVFIHNGGVYLVTDDTKELPPIPDIVSSEGPGFAKWTLLTRAQAKGLFGVFGGVIRGVSWLASDTAPHNSTLIALWRTYTSLFPSSSPFPFSTNLSTSFSSTLSSLPPPHRLILPHTPFFTDSDPDLEKDMVRRRRADTGFHPYLLKAAFPQLTVMYFQDFEDYAKMEKVPYVFERVVVADRKAAKRVLLVNDDGDADAGVVEPEFLTAFELGAREELAQGGDENRKGEWWEPIRRNMLEFMDLDEESLKKPVVTYIVTQDMERGPKLKGEVHERLVSLLQKMERNVGCEVNVINEDTTRTSWIERMEAIVRSTVIIGVHGDHLMDFAFMKRSPHSTLIEMYPENKFVRDRAVIAESLGQQYIAWSGSQQYMVGSLPKASRPRENEEITIDVDAIVKNVQQIISRAR